MKKPIRKSRKSRKPAKPDGWTPVLNGPTFCAPLCGGGCTKKAHDEAHEKAAKLAKSLGPTWQPNVWENLGWHYSAVSPCGRLKVHPFGCGLAGFTAYLDHDGGAGGIWTAQAKTAKAAVRSVVRQAEDEAAKILATLEAVGPLGL